MPPLSSNKKLLLIGASRGLGFALAEEYLKRGWHVVATERDSATSKLHDLLRAAQGRLEIATVDITYPDQVAALRARLASRQFDMLFVNAGIGTRDMVADISTDEFIRMMVTNALSPMRVVESLQELVLPTGTIGIMSSGQGSITNNENGHYEIYRGSKTALNMFMRSFAARHAARHADVPRTLLLMAPGWVRTDLGGPDARLSIEESIPNLANTMDAQAGKAGLQYLNYLGQTVPW
jgi:NAD(P)-dependent dehydrogenase (short-subunit alcohol dehydrogenase family)